MLQEPFARGVDALKNGNLTKAEEAFLYVLNQGGTTAYVYNNLGIVYQQQGEHLKAVEQFQGAVRIQPDYSAPHALMGTSLLALDRVPEAIKHLERATEIEPEEAKFRFQLAIAYERNDDVLRMTDQFRSLRKLEPKNPEFAYQLGKAYLRLMAWSVERMIEIAPRSARVYQALGENYLAEGRLDLAQRALLEAIEVNPQLPGLHWSLAQVYLRKGETTEARKQLEAELAVVPGSVMALGLKKKLEEAANAASSKR